MPSMFEKEAKNVVKELGTKNLIPVTSFYSSNQFRPFCLMRKKRSHIFSHFWEKPLIPTDLSLMDILEPSSINPELTYTGPFKFSFTVDGKLKTDMDFNAGVTIGVSAEVTRSHKSFLEVQIVNVPQVMWTNMQRNRKLLQPEHSFLLECWNRREDLFVVIEAVEVLNSPVIQSSSNIGGDGKLTLSRISNVQDKSGAHLNRQKSVSIPKGSIMAYRAVKLLIQEEKWVILHIPDHEKNTFQYKKTFSPWSKEEQSHTEIGLGSMRGMEEKLEWKDYPKLSLFLETIEETQQGFGWKQQDRNNCQRVRDFQRLLEEVTFQKKDLVRMPGKQRTTLLCALHDLLGNRTALQDLEDKLLHVLDSGIWGKMEGPGNTILSNLQDSSDSPVNGYITGFLYLLEALAALSDNQHDLLAQSLEKKILSQQLKLVKSILETNFNQFHSTFILPPEILSLIDEELNLSLELVEDCGLQLQRTEQMLILDPEGKNPLCALYGALSCLLSLSED
ncbi:gasdermin-C [Sarcophilus harrisii]|nr:gasdermin-C [Sarcophilus harrisii]